MSMWFSDACWRVRARLLACSGRGTILSRYGMYYDTCLFLLCLGRFGSLTHKQDGSQLTFSEPLCHGRCLGADVAEARIGGVAVAAVTDVVGVADNVDGVRFPIIFGGLV